MHLAEQRDAGHRAEQHADRHRYERQQRAPAPQRQQQQQEDTHGSPPADPGDLSAGLALAGGGVQQSAGRQQMGASLVGLLAALGEQVGHLQGQVQVEGIAHGARAQQYPVLAIRLGHQRAAGGVELDIGGPGLAGLDASAQAQPVVLAGDQAEICKGIDQALDALLDEGVGLFGQLLAIGGREHRQAPLQELRTHRLQVGMQVPLHLLEQAAGLPLRGQALGKGERLLAIGMANQHQHLAVQRLLHALFGALHQWVLGRARDQGHQVGGQGCTAMPLPSRDREHGQQQGEEQARQQAFNRQSHDAPTRSRRRLRGCPACAVPCCRLGFRPGRCVRQSAPR